MIAPILILLAAAPTPKTAEYLKRNRKWDELYLAFAAQKPDSFSTADRSRIGAALEAGCEALLGADPVLAYSLGDRGFAFLPSAKGLLCVGRSAYASNQPAAAEKALRLGLARFPAAADFGLELGRQLLEEGDTQGAIEALENVIAASPENAAAQALLAKARKLAAGGPARLEGTHGEEGTAAQPETDALARGDQRFVVEYANEAHPITERPEFVKKLVDALEDASRSVRTTLGTTRGAPLKVLLYRRADRELGQATFLRRPPAFFPSTGVLFWQGVLHVDDGLQFTGPQKEQVFREYLKAVIDEAAHGHAERVPEWMKEGLGTYLLWRLAGTQDPPSRGSREGLKIAVRDHRLASLALATIGPDRVYPLGVRAGEPYCSQYGVAMRLVVGELGTDQLLSLFSTMGDGTKADLALEQALGHPLSELQAELEAEIADL